MKCIFCNRFTAELCPECAQMQVVAERDALAAEVARLRAALAACVEALDERGVKPIREWKHALIPLLKNARTALEREPEEGQQT